MSLLPYLHRVADHQHLSASEAHEAMRTILAGQASTAQIASFAVALRMKGETVDEVVGFARAMREMATAVDVGLEGETLLDTCGTGGDNAGTFNISTLVAFIVAGAGVRVAKHGNRSISSRCGSADLLEAFGVRLTAEPQQVARAIREVGIGFLFAPLFHSAMKHAQPARMELKLRTVFNYLGPLTNPARANAQLVGAPSPKAASLMAHALSRLGIERAFVVHGSDGLDEITTTGDTLAYDVQGNSVRELTLNPGMFGVPPSEPADLAGGDPPRNRDIAEQVLAGATGPWRDIVLVNASAALVAAGKVPDFLSGVALATQTLDSGAARRKLFQLAEFTQGL